MSNKTIGNRFEQDLCEILSEYGFWVHNMMMSKAGQPADIIAARNGIAYLIDAKVCSNNEFPLSRVEENQTLAMDLWADRGNGQGWFALKLNDEVYMLANLVIKAYSNSQSKMSAKDIHDCGIPIERWVKKCK
jgi:Holliday junction resolvase